MRIVHVFNASIVSGPETLVLPSLAVSGLDIIVIFLCETRNGDAANSPIGYAESLGLRVSKVIVRSRIDIRAIFELRKRLESIAPMIVHAHDVKASTYTLLTSSLRRNTWRLVSTHHGVRGRSGLKIKLYERFYSWAVLPWYDRVLTVCSSDREILLKRRLDPDRVSTHLNGVDRAATNPSERAQRRRELHTQWDLSSRGIPEQSFIIGFVGRLAPEKRLDRILNVAHLLLTQHPELPRWDLLVFGSGPLSDQLKDTARATGIDERVHWMGYRSGIGDEMAGIDLLISLSDAEGLPINLIEAGWAATPILAIAADGNLDLVPARDYGILVHANKADIEIAQEIAASLLNQPLLGQSGIKLQHRVQTEFSGKRWRERLLQLYAELVSPR